MGKGLITGEVYHVFTKSIAGYVIFNDESEYERMKYAIQHFLWRDRPLKFSEICKYRERGDE